MSCTSELTKQLMSLPSASVLTQRVCNTCDTLHHYIIHTQHLTIVITYYMEINLENYSRGNLHLYRQPIGVAQKKIGT